MEIEADTYVGITLLILFTEHQTLGVRVLCLIL
jgi:hypothetical protein